MVSVEDNDDNLSRAHDDLVNKLNLNKEIATKSWNSFETIRKNYSLEGDPVHWLGCAIFQACRTQKVPTVGKNTVVGSSVNLTSLLRRCVLSLSQFFDKIKKWADMANLLDDFRQQIQNLESKFSVAFTIFQEFQPMYIKVFKPPNDTETPHRNRKQKTLCTPAQVMEFSWLLFITAKGINSGCAQDLVISCHLLQACCDFIFKNAFLDDRIDLLNPDFEGLPKNWSDSDYTASNDAPCIIDILSAKNKDMITESKYVKEYTWKRIIQTLFQDKILNGNENNFTELLSAANFNANFKSLTKTYEEYLLNKGDIDERILLIEYRRRVNMMKNAAKTERSNQQHNQETGVTKSPRVNSYGEVTQRTPDTPLTGRNYLGPKPKDQSQESPLSTATKTVACLQSLLNGRLPSTSPTLSQIFQSCSVNPTKIIEDIISTLGDKFYTKYRHGANPQIPEADFANKRLRFATTLFYELLEKILLEEKRKLDDISLLLGKSVFYESLFACSLDIVIYSYSSSKKFPWILETLEISEFYFVRVIELIIRSEDQLPRDVVKHLNMVEETILESIMWKSNSLLWNALKNLTDGIPKFEDIGLRNGMIYSTNNGTNNSNSQNNLQSPGPSAVETFQSPMTQVKKQLFPVKAGQPILQKINPAATHLMVTDKAGNKQLIQLVDSSIETVVPITTSPVQDPKPKKNDSLSIIFRKFYNLAGERMEHLCRNLNIDDIQLKCKIWTVFEYSIRNQTELMRDRHLDQLLMCAVYVICKVGDNERKFSNIMQCYRYQPQAKSNIYRDVLLQKLDDQTKSRGDLIEFYNKVYVRVMTQFAMKFSKTNQNKDILLSPIPSVKSLMASPKQQITKNVFVKPFESPSTQSTGKMFKYYFNRSASKDLKAINVSISGKRKLLDFEDDSSIANRKVKTLIEERRVQNM